MVLRKHLLGTVGQLLNGVRIVVHVLLKDHVALEHQHGTLLILERRKKRRMRKNKEEEEEKQLRNYAKKGDRRLHIKAKQNTPNELSIEAATYKKACQLNCRKALPCNHVNACSATWYLHNMICLVLI